MTQSTWKSRRSRSSKRGPEALSEVLLRSGSDKAREGSPLPPRAWHDAVGDRIARRTRPMRLDGSVLTVRAATAVWAQELTFLAPTIVARLRALGFGVESLRFRVGPIEGPDRAPKLPRVKSVPAARALPPGVDQRIAEVVDPELRRVLSRAASANLAWQAATSARPTARVPRFVGAESAPRGRSLPTPPGGSRRKP